MNKPYVSEHAIVRFFERVCKVDMEEIRQQILPDKTMTLYSQLGDGVYTVEKHKVRIKDNTVVTVYEI